VGDASRLLHIEGHQTKGAGETTEQLIAMLNAVGTISNQKCQVLQAGWGGGGVQG
jgi:hypothetical protein